MALPLCMLSQGSFFLCGLTTWSSPHGLSNWAAGLFTQCLKAPRSEHFKKSEAEAASLLKGWAGTPTLPYFLCIPCSIGVQASPDSTWKGLHQGVRARTCGSLGATFGEQLPPIMVYLVNLHQRLLVTLDCSFFISCSPHSDLALSLLWSVPPSILFHTLGFDFLLSLCSTDTGLSPVFNFTDSS